MKAENEGMAAMLMREKLHVDLTVILPFFDSLIKQSSCILKNWAYELKLHCE